MKINLENMKELAVGLDHVDAEFPANLAVADVCNMAYQLQYFFEAMEKIQEEYCNGKVPEEQTTGNYDDAYQSGAYKCSEILRKALVNKED